MDLIGLGTAVLAMAQEAASQALPPPAGGSEGAGGVSPDDFTIGALFLRATLTVQIVVVLLLAASFWSWAIIVEKVLSYRRLHSRMDAFDEEFWSGQSLEELHDRVRHDAASPAERVFVAGMTEWNRSFGDNGGILPGTQQRVERAMQVAIAREAASINNRLSFLATVGSVSPFVGLFGTVWGIKHSFESIALMQNTNLAVVAPGIAEALFATALGLLAAIPAVVAYNRLNGMAEGLTARLENFADEFVTILARQIDRMFMAQGVR